MDWLYTGKGNMKIIIHTDRDLTPDGKRNWRVVSLTSMGRPVSRIRWYVSGRIFRTLGLSGDNLQLSQQWVDAVSDDEPTDETCPHCGEKGIAYGAHCNMVDHPYACSAIPRS